MHQNLLSVIIPAHNEGEIITTTLTSLCTVLAERQTPWEIVVVNDGSADNTSQAIRRFSESQPQVRLVSYDDNRGKGYALRRGYEESTGHTIAFFDADLDIPPESLSRLVDQLEHEDVDGVVGSKVHQDSLVHQSALRRLISSLARRAVRTLFNLSVPETQVGAKVFRREVLEQALPHVKDHQFAFDIELLAWVSKLGFRLGTGPVEIRQRKRRSHVNLISLLRTIVGTLLVLYRIRVADRSRAR